MDQLQELAALLDCGQENVQEIALENLLPYTRSDAGKIHIFKDNDYAAIRSLKKLSGKPNLRRNALSAMVNLCDDKDVREFLAGDHTALASFVLGALDSTANTGLYCMLLANLAHSKDTIDYLLRKNGALLKKLVGQFVKSSTPDYDYLAFTFGESARYDPGASFWVGSGLPLALIVPQLVGDSVTRRAGIAAAIKNTLFEVTYHERVIESGAVEYIMIALKGPESLDEEDTAKLPEIVRAEIGQNKRREEDPNLQLALVECLLLLSSSKVGRAALRQRSTYFIIRELHLGTQDVAVQDACERFVNMIMRGEPEEPKVIEVEDDEDDEEIVEVV